MNTGTLYCYNWTNTATVSISSSATANNAGTVATQDAGAATIDTGSYTTASLTSDQIAVSATVPQTFSFALSGNTDALGALATGSVNVSPTPRTATVNTNAKNGWYVWALDSTTSAGGLRSTAAAYTVASTTPGTNSTLSAGTEGYNTGVTSSQTGGTGTVTVQTPFVGGSTGRGGGLDNGLRALASSTGTANNSVLTLTNNAAINGSTPAATDYSDTITVVGAGLF
jgi:filamentous hemagglutinin